MKALSVARKTLLELWREPMLWALLFVFPVLLVWMYDVSFGGTDQGMARFMKIMILNQDAPEAFGSELVKTIQATEFEGQAVFEVTPMTDQKTAGIALREHKVILLLVIPPGFTQTLLNASQGSMPGSPTAIQLIGDTNSDNFLFARSFLEGILNEFVRLSTGQEPTMVVNYEFIPGTGTMSDFDFGVPGVIVFSIMMLVISTAMIMVRENVAGTLRRLRLTCLKARDLLLGVTLSQMVVAMISVPITFLTALAFGFRSHGSLWLAMGVGLLLSLSAVGLGLVVACFARNDGEAANLGAVAGVLQVLLSDALYPVPDAPLFTLFGRTIQIYDLMPTSHASEALRQVLILGESASSITFELTALCIQAVLLLSVGIFLYQRLQLRKA